MTDATQIPRPSRAALPFPLSGSWEPVEQLDTVLSTWRPYQPDPAPPGWSTDFRPRDDVPDHYDSVPDWTLFARTTEEDSGSELEDAFFLIGTPFPLLYHPSSELIVVLVGGLMVLCTADEDPELVFEAGTTLREIVDAVDNGTLGALSLRSVRMVRGGSYLRSRFEIVWQWEWAEFGRNRWQELKDRGGEVDESWLGERTEKTDWWYF